MKKDVEKLDNRKKTLYLCLRIWNGNRENHLITSTEEND